MTRIRIVTGLSCMGFLCTSAFAENLDSAKGRYAMQPVDGGVLRLDTQSGTMALCTSASGQWTCEPVNDRAAGNDDKLAKLETENKDLKARVKALEEGVATKDPSPPPADGNKMQLPTEQEVDQAFDYVERIFKKFRDRLQKIEPTPKPDGGAL